MSPQARPTCHMEGVILDVTRGDMVDETGKWREGDTEINMEEVWES